MVSPASLSACANDSALATPCAVALRLPTIASAGCCSNSLRPFT